MIPRYNPDQILSIREFLNKPRKIVVTTHHKPDGDAMGSSLALFHFLTERGHQVQVITPSDYPDFLYWLPGNSEVINYEYHPSRSRQATAEAEVIFCLDFNTTSRLEKYAELVVKSKAFKILIDHHLDPDNFCDVTFSFPESCATCELLFHFFRAYEPGCVITPNVAECLYTGIMTDTGSFRFNSTSADTYEITAEIIRSGIHPSEIHEKVYDNFSADRTRFLGFCLKEKLVVLPEYRTAYISVTKEELKQYNHHSGDTEGIVNYALAIKGIRMAAFFCERDNLIKISFRSRDSFSVKEIAGTHFSGGGHHNAAGGRSTDSLENTVKKFLDLLPSLQQELNTVSG